MKQVKLDSDYELWSKRCIARNRILLSPYSLLSFFLLIVATREPSLLRHFLIITFSVCEDDNCETLWVDSGYCHWNSVQYFYDNCQLSCGLCNSTGMLLFFIPIRRNVVTCSWHQTCTVVVYSYNLILKWSTLQSLDKKWHFWRQISIACQHL